MTPLEFFTAELRKWEGITPAPEHAAAHADYLAMIRANIKIAKRWGWDA